VHVANLDLCLDSLLVVRQGGAKLVCRSVAVKCGTKTKGNRTS
jgi:hypothetical protein